MLPKKKNLIILYSSVSITTRPQGLKTGIRTVVLYLHFLTCMDVNSGTFGDKDNATHNCEWTTLKREEVTESLGKTYKVRFVTCTVSLNIIKCDRIKDVT